jgi:Condensation domain
MDQLEVAFRADTGGTFRMTWGQQGIWGPIRHFGDDSAFFNIPVVVDLPGDAPADQASVVGALRRLVERNQALRTHFRDGPVQEIARSGAFVVRLADSTRGDSRARADELAKDLASAHFDHDAEWAIRIALVRADQVPRHIVFVVSHVLADGGGFQALIDDFFGLLRASSADGEPAIRWQPADQALREQSRQGVRRNRAAIGYWRRQLERMPPAMFSFPPGPAAFPRFQELRLESRALTVAAARLAANCQVSVPDAVLTGAGLALAAVSGQTSCVLKVIVGNRFDRDTRGLVAPMAQEGLLVADYPAGTVADAARATSKAARAAYFYGYYDPAAVGDLLAAVAAQRGAEFDLTMFFNDQSAFLDDPFGPEPAAAVAQIPEAEARELLPDTVIAPAGTMQAHGPTVFLKAQSGTDICALQLMADTARLPVPTIAAVLRGIETIVFEAAYRDVAVTEIPALTGLRPATA